MLARAAYARCVAVSLVLISQILGLFKCWVAAAVHSDVFPWAFPGRLLCLDTHMEWPWYQGPPRGIVFPEIKYFSPSIPPLLGGLDLAIEGPSKAEISCIDNKDGTCTVTYLPTLPGDYSILVKYNDKHIPGSPFTAKITGRVARLIGIPHGREVKLCLAPPHLLSLGWQAR